MNRHRDWELFRMYYFHMLDRLSAMAGFRQVRFRIKGKIFLLDSTTVSLCLSLFDWAVFRRRKGAVKLHTLLDYAGCLPAFILMTDGKVHDAIPAKQVSMPGGSVIVADRAYIDFGNMARWDSEECFFVIRSKSSVKYGSLGERPLPDDRHQHILKDEYIMLSEKGTRQKYPKKLRRVVVWDGKNGKVIELVTNNFSWTAATIAELYKARWEIEVFFKEVKQLLKIKSFLGTSPNAVLIQIWTAMITILILKYLRATAKHAWCMSNLVAFLRINLFTKHGLRDLLDNPFKPPPETPGPDTAQMSLFDWGD